MKDRTNKKYWQRLAKIYAPLMESDKKFYGQICGYIKPYLKKNMEVLELACGSGQLSFSLAGNVKKWVATDFSENMIGQAKKRNKNKRIRFCVADATALPFSDESFDCVVISNALHIMPNPERAMQEIQRVLKPGGLLYAPTFLWAERKAGRLRIKLMSLAGFQCYHEWDRSSFRSFVREYGFDVSEMKLVGGGLAPVGTMIAIKKK